MFDVILDENQLDEVVTMIMIKMIMNIISWYLDRDHNDSDGENNYNFLKACEHIAEYLEAYWRATLPTGMTSIIHCWANMKAWLHQIFQNMQKDEIILILTFLLKHGLREALVQ